MCFGFGIAVFGFAMECPVFGFGIAVFGFGIECLMFGFPIGVFGFGMEHWCLALEWNAGVWLWNGMLHPAFQEIFASDAIFTAIENYPMTTHELQVCGYGSKRLVGINSSAPTVIKTGQGTPSHLRLEAVRSPRRRCIQVPRPSGSPFEKMAWSFGWQELLL
jgi:hypothetical protein